MRARRRKFHRLACLLALMAGLPHVRAQQEGREYERRVRQVTSTNGLIAFWDFVKREDGSGGSGRFDAYKGRTESADFRLDVLNYVRDYWGEGREATYADIPLLGRGPFGQAIEVVNEADPSFRPCLLVPRDRLHGSGLDVKGPGRSVSMTAWVVRQGGNHAIAGIWHEGTDLQHQGSAARRVEKGKRQYALFAGLAANEGGSAVHVSENGAKSFGDKYARNLAVTPGKLKTVPYDAAGGHLDRAWSVMGFVFNNDRNTVTAYLDGEAAEYWIDDPSSHPFFKWPANGWLQAELRRQPGLQEGEDPAFPSDQFYTPPETKARSIRILQEGRETRVELRVYEFTKVKVTMVKMPSGKWSDARRELVALKANPFWFGHDLYSPATMADGGPFTIGRVIHSSRSVGFTGWIGGVAVFGRALSPTDMRRLARIGRDDSRKPEEFVPIQTPGNRAVVRRVDCSSLQPAAGRLRF